MSGIKRVVITGLGAVTALGNSVNEFWPRLLNSECGIDKLTMFDTTNYQVKIAGEAKNFNIENFGFDKKSARRMARFMQLGIAAAKEAITDSGYNIAAEPESIGVIMGSGVGGIEAIEDNLATMSQKGPSRVSPFLVPMMISDSAAGIIAINFGAKGANQCTTTACASGTHSIGDAFRLIKHGYLTAAIAGGAEACLTPLAVAGFQSAQALCEDSNDNPQGASRPFDASRTGFVMGEGAGVLILEEMEHALARGAKIYAEMVGYGSTGDAYHITSPAPGGEGGARAMNLALNEAKLKPTDVSYINAHGTSTKLNDKYESAAIISVFGAETKVKISSTKGAIGHCLGAAGGIEAVILAKTIETDTIPPTINYKNPDPECPLDYTPNKAVKMPIHAAMSNSFGFGGHNGIILFKKFKK